MNEQINYLTKELAKLQRRVDNISEGLHYGGERPYLRDGEPWTNFEKDHLYDHLLILVDSLSTKFGRTHNAIWWAMSRVARDKRK